jgi:16S rRNA processing protein RimM
VGAHGVRGEVVVHAYTASPESIGAYGPLSDADGKRSFVIESVRVTPKGVVARIRSIEDRTAAEALKGVGLYVGRGRLPAAGEGEFYVADLVGLAAVDPQGKLLGEIVAVQNYGAGDLLEIRPASGGGSELIPFTEAAVPQIDMATGRAVIVMPRIAAPDEDPPPG